MRFKLEMLVSAIVITVGIYAMSFIPTAEKNIEMEAEASEQKEYVTELFMIQDEINNEYVLAKPLDESEAPHGYFLENKYELGDIVELTYLEDDVLGEKKITGERLEEIEIAYDEIINYYMDETIAE